MKDPYNYRNRAQMPVGYDQDGIMVGFYSMNSRELVNVTDCDVQYEEINTVINHAVDLLDDIKCLLTHQNTQRTARYIVVRRGFKTGEVQVTFCFC